MVQVGKSMLSFPELLMQSEFKDAEGWTWQMKVFCLACEPARVGNDFLITYSAEARLEVTEKYLNQIGFDGMRLCRMSTKVPDIVQSFSAQKKLNIEKIQEVGHKFGLAVEAKFCQTFSRLWKKERLSELVDRLVFSPFSVPLEIEAKKC